MEVVLNTSGLRKLRSLLLIHLFAVNAAADCSGPPAVQDDIDLSAKSRMVDEYREGVQLQLECVSGYVRINGSGITTCNSGNWTKSDLICTKKDCGPPREQPHMKFNLSQGTLFGDVAQVLCDKGYLLTGVTFKQCVSFGWFGKAICLAVVCKPPPEVANGSSSWSGPENPKYGETIMYSCEEGYTLFGNSSITCDENGGYTPGPPECRKTTSTVTSVISILQRNKFATTQASSTVSPSQEDVPGINGNKESVSVPVLISLTAVFLVIIIVIGFLCMLHQKKKGSYDTGEDLKPELLQFQNL